MEWPAAILGGLVGVDELEELGEAEILGGPEGSGIQSVTVLWNEGLTIIPAT